MSDPQATSTAGAGAAAGASAATGASASASGARRAEPGRAVSSAVNSQWPAGYGLSSATATAVLSGVASTAPLPAAPRTTPQLTVSPARDRESAGEPQPVENPQTSAAKGAAADAPVDAPVGNAKTAKGADAESPDANTGRARGDREKAAAKTGRAKTDSDAAGAAAAGGDTPDDSAATQASAYRLRSRSSAQRTAAGATDPAKRAARPGDTVDAAPQSAYASPGYGPMPGYAAGSGAGGYAPNAAGYPGGPQYPAGAPWGAGYAPAAPPPRRSRALVVTAIVLASVLALALGGLLGHFAPFGDDAESAQTGATPTTSAAMPDGVFVVVSGISGQFTHAGTLSASTTQEFATNVAQGYAESGAAGQEAQFRAYSPTTDRTYRVSCEPRGDGTVLCVGGRNAQIVLWP